MGKGNGSGGVLFPNTRGGKNIREWLEKGTFPANALSMGMTFSRPTREQAKEQAQKNSLQSFKDPDTKNMLDLIFEKARDSKLEKKLLEALEKNLESLKPKTYPENPDFGSLNEYKPNSNVTLDNITTYSFKTNDDAVHAFNKLYQQLRSDFNYADAKYEHGAVIHRWNNGNGDYYTLSRVVVGVDTADESTSNTIQVNSVVKERTTVAWIHTHPNTEYFTDKDYSYGYAWDFVERAYLITPSGEIKMSERREADEDYDGYFVRNLEDYKDSKGNIIVKVGKVSYYTKDYPVEDAINRLTKYEIVY